MQIETPEQYFKITGPADRQLERIENKLTALLDELSEIKGQISREKKRGKLRKLHDRARQIEIEVREARAQEKELNHSLFGGMDNV